MKADDSDSSATNPEALQDTSVEAICAALKSEDFPGDLARYQAQWLCERGGFATLKSSQYTGQGNASITEYFAEHDKTMYYATGFSLPGDFAKTQTLGQSYCENFEAMRAGFGGRGFESIKSVDISAATDKSCEYLQVAVPEWGVRADIKGTTLFDKLPGLNVYWKVDAMVAPLNYSPIKQQSALFLAWEENSKIQGVYLIRTQAQVSGVFMGTTRSRLRATISALMEGTARFVK